MSKPPQQGSIPRVARAAGTADVKASDPFEKVHRLLDEQEEAAALTRKGGNVNRTYRRWPFRGEAVEVVLHHIGGAVTTKMVPRDISSLGVGLLHTAYMHVGTRVTVRLRVIGGGATEHHGKVVRCMHRGGKLHHLGMLFDDPIDPSRYEASIAERERFAVEQVNTNDLKGSLLHVDDSAVDRELLAGLLANTALRVTAAKSAAEARAKIGRSRWGVVVIDQHLSDGLGTELIPVLREAGCRSPMVLLTADDSPATRVTLEASGADAVLFKPMQARVVQSTLASLLTIPQRDGTSVSTVEPSDPIYELVPGYVASVQAKAEILEAAVSSKDRAAAAAECLALAGSARGYGFEPLGVAAAETRAIVAKAEWNAETAAALRRLAAMCRNVRLGDEQDAA